MRNTLSSQDLPRRPPFMYQQSSGTRYKYTQDIDSKVRTKTTPITIPYNNTINNNSNVNGRSPPAKQKQNMLRNTNITRYSPYLQQYPSISSHYNNNNLPSQYPSSTSYGIPHPTHTNTNNYTHTYSPSQPKTHNHTHTHPQLNIHNHNKSTSSTYQATHNPTRSTQNLHILQLQSLILQLQAQVDSQQYQMQTLSSQCSHFMSLCQQNKQQLISINIQGIRIQYQQQIQQLLTQRSKIQEIIMQLQQDYAEVYAKQQVEIQNMRKNNQCIAENIQQELQRKRSILAIVTQRDRELLQLEVDYRQAEDRIDQLRNIQRKFTIALRQLEMLNTKKANKNNSNTSILPVSHRTSTPHRLQKQPLASIQQRHEHDLRKQYKYQPSPSKMSPSKRSLASPLHRTQSRNKQLQQYKQQIEKQFLRSIEKGKNSARSMQNQRQRYMTSQYQR